MKIANLSCYRRGLSSEMSGNPKSKIENPKWKLGGR